MTIQKLLHPIMLRLFPLAKDFPLTPFSVHPIPESSPVIFVINHSNMHDFPVTAEIVRRHFYVLADDAPRKKITGLAFVANGVVWVKRADKESRRQSAEEIRSHLRRGDNLLILPEGTWNLHECLPMLPFSWGVTELAREFNCPIVPITLEFPDFKSCYYSIGKAFYVEPNESKADAVGRLRDTLSTMRWLFWESRGITKRENITQEDFDIYTKHRLEEYPPFDLPLEKTMVFHAGNTLPEDAFAHLKSIIPTKETAFLFSQREICSCFRCLLSENARSI